VHDGVDDVGSDVGLVSPDVGEQGVPRHGGSLVLPQVVQRLELQRGEVDAPPVDEQLPSPHVK
jgi:hypothetical protein